MKPKAAGYKDLGVWQKDPLGNESLSSLSEVGIDAISAGRLATPFSIKNAGNELLGEVREAGFFLREDGSAAPI